MKDTDTEFRKTRKNLMVLDGIRYISKKSWLFNVYRLQTVIYKYSSRYWCVWLCVCVHRCIDTYIYLLVDQSISLCCVSANGFSHDWLCNSMTAACQSHLSLGFLRQEYWSRLLCPPPGDLPDSGIEPVSAMSNLHWQVGPLPLAPPGKPTSLC